MIQPQKTLQTRGFCSRGIRIDNLPARAGSVTPRSDVARYLQVIEHAKGRRRATQFISVNYEHIPAELLTHLTLGVATCKAAGPLI